MSTTKLVLNPVKTGVLLVMSPHHLAAYGRPVLALVNLTIPPSDFIWNLGCTFDGHMTMETFVLAICVKYTFSFEEDWQHLSLSLYGGLSLSCGITSAVNPGLL